MKIKSWVIGSVLLCCLLPLSSVWAANEAAVGKVLMAVGDVYARDGSDERSLKRRSKVYEGDVLVTGESGQAQVRMKDGALIALGENTVFEVKAYSYDEAEQDDKVVLSVLKGGLRSITGKVEKSAYTMETPVATLGIRGTVFDIYVGADGSTTVILREGGVDVTGQVGEQILLNLAGLSTVVNQGQAPTQPAPAPAEVQQYLQSILPVPADDASWQESPDAGTTIITIDVDTTDILLNPNVNTQPPTTNDTGIPPVEVTPPPEPPEPPPREEEGGEYEMPL